MKITITDGNNIQNLDVDPNEQIENIKALIQVEMGVPSDRQLLYFQGKLLNDSDRLNQKGVKEDQLIFINIGPPKPKPQTQPQGGMSIADMIKNFNKNKQQNMMKFMFPEKKVQQFLSSAEDIYREVKDDPFRLSELQGTQPELAALIHKGDVKGIASYMKGIHDSKIKKLMDQQKKFRELSKDPMNPQYQRMVQERIHQQNIDKNYEYAHEYVPEVFGHINMLYINASINKVPIQAFVDSGAQSTIMSQSLAERCGLMRLVDKRAAGTAVGVGSCKILGKIHAAEIQIQKKFITCSFTVIENNSVEFLLGLDMLKRFNCIINLKRNELNFSDGMIVTKFLGDGEIKKNNATPSRQELEAKINKITAMGFSKDQAIRALKSCNYNEQIASNTLMQQKFGK